ncbi:MAG: Flp pilus assembly protein CpaB [Nocardioidaceae bacterium]|nr:Flp pilus assembly protein CpaB [Nocardioidaceae bacterium]
MKRKGVLLVVAVVIAAVGASLVLLYVNGLAGAAKANESLVKVLAATEVIEPGQTAEQAQAEGKLALTEIPQSSVVKGALTSVETIGDKVALSTIYPGEQILAAKFGTTAASKQTLTIPKGQLAVSLELSDPARVAGFVTPGSHVVIFVSSAVTATDTTAESNFTRILVPNVEVIGVGETTVLSAASDKADDASTEEVPKTILTVALDQADAERVIFASGTGGLTFGLLAEGTKITPGKGVTSADLLK